MPIARRPGRPPHPDILTKAEWRVVDAVRHGLTNPQIAARLDVTVDAVKYHVANALAKLDFPTRAQLRRWNGIRRDSPLFDKDVSMDDRPNLGPLHQIARTVADIEAARGFYEEVLGLPHLYSFSGMSFFDCGGVRLYLSQGETVGPESILYFRVDDIRATHAVLTSRGVVFTNAPHRIHRHDDGAEEWLAIFEDNEGRPLAIMARVAP